MIENRYLILHHLHAKRRLAGLKISIRLAMNGGNGSATHGTVTHGLIQGSRLLTSRRMRVMRLGSIVRMKMKSKKRSWKSIPMDLPICQKGMG